MNLKQWLCCVVIFMSFFSGCKPTVSTVRPTEAKHIATSPNMISPKIETPVILQTKTRMPINTLMPEEASKTIKLLLQEANDCSAPCFWGIVPGQTTIGEANAIFNHLGLEMASTTVEGKDFSGIHYELDSDLSLAFTLSIKNGLVENFRIGIYPSSQKIGLINEWLAYSPGTLINRYEMPSRVDFSADWGPASEFSMQMYFDQLDLIVEYGGQDIIPRKKGPSWVCPLTAELDGIRLWSGNNPVYPPGEGISVEIATPLTIEEFSKLMTGNPNEACFLFKGDVFP